MQNCLMQKKINVVNSDIFQFVVCPFFLSKLYRKKGKAPPLWFGLSACLYVCCCVFQRCVEVSADKLGERESEKKLRREPTRIMSQQERKSKDRASLDSMLESHSYSQSSGSRQADGWGNKFNQGPGEV